MHGKSTDNEVVSSGANADTASAIEKIDKPDVGNRPKEIGGRDGLDPTRYGDWEKAGRCIDF